MYSPEAHEQLIKNVGKRISASKNGEQVNVLPHARMLGIDTHELHPTKDPEHADVNVWNEYFNRPGQHIERPGKSGAHIAEETGKQSNKDYTSRTHYRLGYLLSDLLRNGELSPSKIPDKNKVEQSVNKYFTRHTPWYGTPKQFQAGKDPEYTDQDRAQQFAKKEQELGREIPVLAYQDHYPQTAHSAISVINDRLNVKNPYGHEHHHKDYIHGLLTKAAQWEKAKDQIYQNQVKEKVQNIQDPATKEHQIKAIQEAVDHQRASNGFINPYIHALTSYLIAARQSTHDPGLREYSSWKTPNVSAEGVEEKDTRTTPFDTEEESANVKKEPDKLDHHTQLGRYIADKIHVDQNGQSRTVGKSGPVKLSRYFPQLNTGILSSLLQDKTGSIHHLIHSLSEVDNPDNLPKYRKEDTDESRRPHSNKMKRYDRLFKLFDKDLTVQNFNVDNLLDGVYGEGDVQVSPAKLHGLTTKLHALTAGGQQAHIMDVVRVLKDEDPDLIHLVLNPQNQVFQFKPTPRQKRGFEHVTRLAELPKFEKLRNHIAGNSRPTAGIGSDELTDEHFNPEVDLSAQRKLRNLVRAQHQLFNPDVKHETLADWTDTASENFKVPKEPRAKKIYEPKEKKIKQEATNEQKLNNWANNTTGEGFLNLSNSPFSDTTPAEFLSDPAKQLALVYAAKHLLSTEGEESADRFINALGTGVYQSKQKTNAPITFPHQQHFNAVKKLWQQEKNIPLEPEQLAYATKLLTRERLRVKKSMDNFKKYLAVCCGFHDL